MEVAAEGRGEERKERGIESSRHLARVALRGEARSGKVWTAGSILRI